MTRFSAFIYTAIVCCYQLITSCGLNQPLLGDQPIEKDKTYIVTLTHIKLPDSSGVAKKFDAAMVKVKEQAKNADGHIGFSLRQITGGSDRWTMSVWKDLKSMSDFASSGAHYEAMKDILPLMEEGRTMHYEEIGKNLPVPWDIAIEKLETEGIIRK